MKLTKLKPERLKPKIIYTFDYETDITMVHEKLVCLAKYNPISQRFKVNTFYTTEDFILYCFSNNIKEIYGYNLKFDSRFFIDFLLNHKEATINMIRGGSTIMSLFLRYNGKEIRFRDFYPFCLCSLDAIAQTYKLKNQKYPKFDESDKKNWADFFTYCSLEELEAHCIADVKILAELIIKYRLNFFNEYKIDITGRKIYSLAGLSMKVLRTKYITEPIHNPFIYRKGREYIIDRKQYDFVRRSYHGGYTGNTDNEVHYNIISADISSSYPFQCMDEKFPTGKAYFTENKQDFEQNTKEIAGFCEIEVDFSSTNIKFPVYDEISKEFKSVNSIWSGVVTSYEYYYLLEKNVRLKFIMGLFYTDYDKTFVLERYMKDMYEKKKHSVTPELRFINKRLLTNLTGKFGQRINLENRINERIVDFDYIENMDCEITTYSEPLMENLHYIYQKEERESLKAYTIPSWISIITAKGRIQLLRMIELMDAIYWDTDSVYFDMKNINRFNFVDNDNDVKLGCWCIEHKYEKLRAIAPKLYAGLLKEPENNSFIFVRSKGINLNNDELLRKELYDKIFNCVDTITFSQTRPLSLRQSLRVKNCSNSSISGLVKSNTYNSNNNRKIKY